MSPGSGAGAARRELATTARLAAPLVGGQLAFLGMNFVDTVMAGRLDAAALAAVAIGASLWSSVNLFLLGVLLALPPHVSELDGEGSAAARAGIAPLTRQGFWIGMGLAVTAIVLILNVRPLLVALDVQPELVPTIEGYLAAIAWGVPAWCVYLVLRFLSEGLGKTAPILYFGLLGLAVNVLANWVLMYGKWGLPALGAVGCGWATSIVWTAQCLAMALYVARHRRYRGLDLFTRLEPPRAAPIGRLLHTGAPIGVSLFVEGSLFGVIALLLGSLGTTVVAGHQVALNFAAITFMVPLGISLAITVRVGNAVGRRDPGAVRFRAAVGTGLALACQLVSVFVMLVFPERVAAIYTDDPAVAAVAVELLFLAAIFQISDGVQVAAAGALRGLKDTRVPMLVTVVSYWLLGLPVGWWLGFGRGQGAAGVWVGLIVGLTVAAILLSWRFDRVSRRPLPAVAPPEAEAATPPA